MALRRHLLLSKLGRIPVLKARMNADLHMADDLKNTGKGNLFVIFGEPDIDLIPEGDDQLRVKINGVDVFKPQTGEIVSDNTDGIGRGGLQLARAPRACQHSTRFKKSGSVSLVS